MSVATDVGRALSDYLRAVLRNAVISTLLFIAGFAIAGVPWWLLTGLLAGILNQVPWLGAIVSLLLTFLVLLFADATMYTMAAAGAVWLVVQIVESFVLSPMAAGKAGVPPLLSIALVLIAGFVFGPVGIVLVVPVAAVLFVIARTARRR